MLEFVADRLMAGDPCQIATYAIRDGKILMSSALIHGLLIEITARLHDFITAWPEGSSYLGFIFARGETPEFVEEVLREAYSTLRFTIARRLPVAHPASG